MTARQSLIDELESAIATTDIGRRAETLRRVTDLFLSVSGRYDEADLDLFDDVMGRLCAEIETAARAALAARLAGVADAPRRLMRNLCGDDAIEVAGPVLCRSTRLDDETLVETAKTKSQDHLLAIAQRDTIAEAITEVLVARGNPRVVLITVKNPGARFSEMGCSKLVSRSGTDERLAVGIWLRADMPRHHLVRLFVEASEIIRLKMEAAHPRRANMIRDIIAKVSDNIQATTRTQFGDYQAAYALVESLHAAGQLNIAKLQEFAKQRKFDETVVALSLLCELPIGFVERGLVQERAELVLVFAKAIGLGWDATRSILLVAAGDGKCSPKQLEDALASFTRLKPETAQMAVRFYRLRELAGNGVNRGGSNIDPLGAAES